MTPAGARYRGRFAPSPTGPLHLGSLVAALASYLDARAAGGSWLLRMEDLDPPREQPGAARAIIDSLAAHGFHWDGPIMWQSARGAAYEAALSALRDAGHLFACSCTRRETDAAGNCAGTCRLRSQATGRPCAWRVIVPDDFHTTWEDRWQGQHVWRHEQLPRDFVVRRKDGLYAYQLAVVVDDHEQGITRIVRGSDLLDSTPRQHCLQDLLAYPRPAYDHLPVLHNDQGQKLSKQNLAPPLDDRRAADNLRQALGYLGQDEPPAAAPDCRSILEHATAHWQPQAVPACPSLAWRG